MNQLKISFFTLLAAVLIVSSCDNNDDNPSFSAPTVTTNSQSINVRPGETASVTFNVTVDSRLTGTLGCQRPKCHCQHCQWHPWKCQRNGNG